MKFLATPLQLTTTTDRATLPHTQRLVGQMALCVCNVCSGIIADPALSPDKRFSEFLGGRRRRFSEFLGGRKRFSEFLGGRKRFSEFLGGKKRFSEFLGGKRNT